MAKFHNKGCFVMTEDRVIDEYERLFVFNRAADLRAARCRFVQDVCNDAQRAWLAAKKKVDVSLYAAPVSQVAEPVLS